MAVKKSSKKKQGRQIQLSDRTKKIMLAGSGSVLMIVLAWWAYFTFTTITPPDITKASAKQIADYLGNDRGITRLNNDNRRKYLDKMWSQFSEGDKYAQLSKAFDEMTPVEKQVFVDTVFDTAKEEFVKQAGEFNNTPPHKRTEFVDQIINDIEMQRRSVGGGGGVGVGGGGGAGVTRGGGRGRANITKAFEGSVPHTTDGMTKVLVDRTTARQRAKAQPLFDAVAIRYKERQEQQRH